jgi:sulfite reductase alpha subunit-like flavoprotein
MSVVPACSVICKVEPLVAQNAVVIFTGPITLQTALARHADLLSPLSKQSVASFAAFAEGEDQEQLLALLTGEGGAAYKEWHLMSKCLLELMEEFPNVKVPLGVPLHAQSNFLASIFTCGG